MLNPINDGDGEFSDLSLQIGDDGRVKSIPSLPPLLSSQLVTVQGMEAAREDAKAQEIDVDGGVESNVVVMVLQIGKAA